MVSLSSVARRLPHHVNAILTDFFEVCEYPNDAEKLMLTAACGLRVVGNTEQWCKPISIPQALKVAYRMAVNLTRKEVESTTEARPIIEIRRRLFEAEVGLHLQAQAKMRERVGSEASEDRKHTGDVGLHGDQGKPDGQPLRLAV